MTIMRLLQIMSNAFSCGRPKGTHILISDNSGCLTEHPVYHPFEYHIEVLGRSNSRQDLLDSVIGNVRVDKYLGVAVISLR